MALLVPENSRQPGSRIDDTRILRPRDELRLVGSAGFMALIAVLDSHNPRAEIRPTLRELLGLKSSPLGNHHHILVQVEEEPEEVLSTGLIVGQGEPRDLLFHHRRIYVDDEHYTARLEQLTRRLRSDNGELYYISDHEQLSATPQGQQYVDGEGNLLR